MEHEVDGDRAAQHLREITSSDSDFAEQPVWPASPAWIPIPAALGQVFSSHNSETRRNDLHEDRHQAGQADHPQQSIFVLRTTRQIGAPVARIHVSDADQNGRPNERPPLLPKASLMVRHRYAAVHPFKRPVAEVASTMLDCGFLI